MSLRVTVRCPAMSSASLQQPGSFCCWDCSGPAQQRHHGRIIPLQGSTISKSWSSWSSFRNPLTFFSLFNNGLTSRDKNKLRDTDIINCTKDNRVGVARHWAALQDEQIIYTQRRGPRALLKICSAFPKANEQLRKLDYVYCREVGCVKIRPNEGGHWPCCMDPDTLE